MISDPLENTISTEFKDPLALTTIRYADRTEYYFTIHPTPETGGSLTAQIQSVYGCLIEQLQALNARILYERIYADEAAWSEVTIERQKLLEAVDRFDQGKAALFDGGPCEGSGLSGIQVWAISGVELKPVVHRGAVCGRIFRVAEGEYAILSAIQSEPEPDKLKHAYRMFEEAAVLLQDIGFSYKTNILRTWIYLEDILAWYDDFNRARSTIYRKIGVMASDGFLPASTGIGFSVPGEGFCLMDVLAFKRAEGSDVTIKRCFNPLQNEAPDYGSAFTRGTELTVGDLRTALISGTASIDESGATIHQGDARRQMIRTIENIQALLVQSGLRWEDISQGTVFLPSRDLHAVYQEVAREMNLPRTPLMEVVGVVCRDDLLVEIEAVAVGKISRD